MIQPIKQFSNNLTKIIDTNSTKIDSWMSSKMKLKINQQQFTNQNLFLFLLFFFHIHGYKHWTKKKSISVFKKKKYTPRDKILFLCTILLSNWNRLWNNTIFHRLLTNSVLCFFFDICSIIRFFEFIFHFVRILFNCCFLFFALSYFIILFSFLIKYLKWICFHWFLIIHLDLFDCVIFLMIVYLDIQFVFFFLWIQTIACIFFVFANFPPKCLIMFEPCFVLLSRIFDSDPNFHIFYFCAFKYNKNAFDAYCLSALICSGTVTIVLPLPDPDNPKEHEACCPLCKISFFYDFGIQICIFHWSIQMVCVENRWKMTTLFEPS